MTRRAFLQGLTGFVVATENAVALPSPVSPPIPSLLAQPWFSKALPLPLRKGKCCG